MSCSIKGNYTDGDSVVEFADVAITAGSDVGFIPFR